MSSARPSGENRVFHGVPIEHQMVRWQAANCTEIVDTLAGEEPLELRLARRPLTVTMRTPGHDLELAAGLLYTQGLLRSAEDLGATNSDPFAPNQLDIELSAAVEAEERWRRYSFASSSCGICGISSMESQVIDYAPITSRLRVHTAALYTLNARLRAAQADFGTTGGTHAAALFTADGNTVVVREDVGRHNAVDKVIGHALLGDLLPLEQYILLVSGRISYEIVQKALAARVPVVAAVSAPTALSARIAQEFGMTLIGFLRGEHMNVYAHPERIVP